MKDNNSMNNLNKDDADKFLQKFGSEASEPGSEFASELKAKIIKKNNKSNLFVNPFTMQQKYRFASFVLMWALLVGGITSISYLYINSLKVDDSSDLNNKASLELDSNTILAKVASANSTSVARNNSLANAGKVSLEANQANDMAMAQYMPSIGREYNYYHSTTTTESGLAYSACYGYEQSEEEKFSNMESFDYGKADTSGTWSYANKMISKDKDGDIVYYGINKGNTNLEYRGGKYAVQIKYDFSEKMTSTVQPQSIVPSQERIDNIEIDTSVEPSEPQTDDVRYDDVPEPDVVYDNIDAINWLFGDNPVINKVVIDGVTYYEIVSKNTWTCGSGIEGGFMGMTKSSLSSSLTERSDEGKIAVSKRIVDTETYEIIKEELYLESIDPKNLISTFNNEVEKKNVEFAEVEKFFEFDYPSVEIKNIVVNNLGSDDYNRINLEIIKAYLESNKLTIPYAERSDYKLSYFYVDSPRNSELNGYSFDFYNDRNFYADGIKGDKAFVSARIVNPVNVSYSYDLSNSAYYSNLGVSIFDKTVAMDEALVYLGITKQNKSEDVEITVGKTKFKAKIYDRADMMAQDISVSSDGKNIAEPYIENRLSYQSKLLMFVLDSKVYAIDFNVNQTDPNTKIALPALPTSYLSYNTGDKNDLVALMERITKLYTEPRIDPPMNIEGSEGEGSSGSSEGSEGTAYPTVTKELNRLQ